MGASADKSGAADPAGCTANLAAGLLLGTASCPIGCTTCPDGLQDIIDDAYSQCDGAADWEAGKPVIKADVEAIGCDGAAQAMPAFVLVAAAAVNHILN